MSEINIELPSREQLKILPYVNQPMSAVVVLDKKFYGTNGQSEILINIKSRIPDPLRPNDTTLSLLKKTTCHKN